jgi:enamine deaminase RidA (YjgF/YER057c/UK114 family)
VGSHADGLPEPDFAKQVQLAFDNLVAVLEGAGCGMQDIVDVTTFHTDPEMQFDTVMEVKNRLFPVPPYPNWTAVGLTWLSGFDFEIKVIARCPAP